VKAVKSHWHLLTSSQEIQEPKQTCMTHRAQLPWLATLVLGAVPGFHRPKLGKLPGTLALASAGIARHVVGSCSHWFTRSFQLHFWLSIKTSS
jgi:hypothetical protein